MLGFWLEADADDFRAMKYVWVKVGFSMPLLNEELTRLVVLQARELSSTGLAGPSLCDDNICHTAD